MTATKQEIKKNIPLYSDLAGLVLEFLEPCFDYSVSTCTHEKAFCQCGNLFKFHVGLFHTERLLLEKFCPLCGTENPHKTLILGEYPPVLVRTKKYLKCPRCFKHAESYQHHFCSGCQHKLAYVQW